MNFDGQKCNCGRYTLGRGQIMGQPLHPSPVRISSGGTLKPETLREEIHSVDRCTSWRMVATELKP